MVETVHKIMAAKALNGGWGLRNVANADSDAHGNLKVLIEVNTSRKQGVYVGKCSARPTQLLLHKEQVALLLLLYV